MNVIFGIYSSTLPLPFAGLREEEEQLFPDPAFEVAHRDAGQRLADTAVHAPLGERLAERLQRLGGGVDLVAILAGRGCLDPGPRRIERGALLDRQQAAVLGERGLEGQQAAP